VIVLDASVLIAYLDGNDVHHAAAERLMTREIDDDFAVNPLTLAEVLVRPARVGRLDVAGAVFRDLGVVEQLFPTETAVQLAHLGASTGLRMPDCCVLLTAGQTGARVATFDVPLAKAAGGLGLVAITS
jgi:predicted nucleic acid-binding protein